MWDRERDRKKEIKRFVKYAWTLNILKCDKQLNKWSAIKIKKKHTQK